MLKAKGAGILHPTASNSNKNGPYKAKKAMAGLVRQKQVRDMKQRMFLEEQEEMQNPPPISEEDINKGMISLLNRGIIPKDVDLTPAFEKGAPPVQFKTMRFHDKAEMYIKQEVQNERFNRNSLKFDMQLATSKAAQERQLALRSMAPEGTQTEKVGSGAQLALEAPPIREEGAQQLALTDQKTSVGARGYNELMDEYSLHQLIFRKGKLLDETPEFASFRRTFIDKWGPISYIMMKFESLFKKYDVQHVVVDGRKLVELAQEKLDPPKEKEMYECIINKEEVGKLIKIPELMFIGPEGPIKAATVIQKNFRMFKARESYRHLLFLMKKATKIQRRFRLYLFQKQTKDRVEELTNESLFVWKEMMDEFKAKWPAIKTRRRVEVHINSLSIEELKRISMEKFL